MKTVKCKVWVITYYSKDNDPDTKYNTYCHKSRYNHSRAISLIMI